MIRPSISNEAVFTALRSFLLPIVDCEVRQLQENNVPMPQGSFVGMTDIGKKRLATNAHDYESGEILTPTEFRIQLDFYGEDAADMCQSFIKLFNDSYAYEHFPPNIKPLYTDNARQVPLISGEENYVSRWTVEIHLQFNPTVTIPVTKIEDIPVFTILANGDL